MAEVWQATITDSAGNIIPRAVVDVRDETTGDLAPIFSDVDGLVPQRNPFFADDVGFARFYADAGLYQVRARRGAEERIYENVLLGDASATYYVWQHQVSDSEGNALAQALVEFRDADTDALATLYADENGSAPLDNPFRADDDGVARCYVAAGVYKIAVSRGASFEVTYQHVVVGPPPTLDLYAWQSLVVNEAGDVQPGASVLVTDKETDDPATIYEDDEETPLANPFETGDDGMARFYVAAGTYDIRIRDHCVQQVLRDVSLGPRPASTIIAIAEQSFAVLTSDLIAGTAHEIQGDGQNWRGVAYSPTVARVLAVFTGVGNRVNYSDDGGQTWTAIFGTGVNFERTRWSTVFSRFYTGTNNGVLCRSDTGSSAWTQMFAAPQQRSYDVWESVDEGMIVGVGNEGADTTAPALCYTTNGTSLVGGMVTGLPSGSTANNTLRAVRYDKYRSLWFVLNGLGVLYSSPSVSSGSWTTLGGTSSAPGSAVMAIAIKPGGGTNPIVIAAASLGLWTSTDGGATFTQTSNQVAHDVLWSDAHNKFIACGRTASGSGNTGRLFYSAAGASWSQSEFFLPPLGGALNNFLALTEMI